MQSHNNNHTGRSPFSTTPKDGFEKWRFECDLLESNPVIDKESIIYFWGGYNDFPWYLWFGKRYDLDDDDLELSEETILLIKSREEYKKGNVYSLKDIIERNKIK